MPTSAPPNSARTSRAAQRVWLEELHRRYQHRRFVSPDPLEVLYAYSRVRDREIVGLIAASLAYGNVKAMLPAIRRVLETLGPRPAATLLEGDLTVIRRRLRGFRYRFTTDRQIIGLLTAAGAILHEHGRLEACLPANSNRTHDVMPALAALAGALRAASPVPLDHLIPDPDGGSACKRLNLYMRWMVRRDDIDPGGWRRLQARQLIMPLDTHVYRTAVGAGWTQRRTPDLKTAREITDALRNICPEDPLRYDFVITRPGIRKEAAPPPPVAVARKRR